MNWWQSESRRDLPGDGSRVLVLEPRPLVAAGLCSLLAEWAGIAARPLESVLAALRAASASPAVILVGTGLPPEERGPGLLHLCAECPSSRIVLLGSTPRLPKAPRFSVLPRGEATPPEVLRQQVLRHLAELLADPGGRRAPTRRQGDARDRVLLDLIGQGRTNREIGAVLCLAESTVKWRIQKLCKQHGARNRVELLRRMTGDTTPRGAR